MVETWNGRSIPGIGPLFSLHSEIFSLSGVVDSALEWFDCLSIKKSWPPVIMSHTIGQTDRFCSPGLFCAWPFHTGMCCFCRAIIKWSPHNIWGNDKRRGDLFFNYLLLLLPFGKVTASLRRSKNQFDIGYLFINCFWGEVSRWASYCGVCFHRFSRRVNEYHRRCSSFSPPTVINVRPLFPFPPIIASLNTVPKKLLPPPID
jgi:hypothetical protein